MIALAAAPALVLGNVWDEPRVADLRESPVGMGGALVGVVALVGGTTAVFRRWPQAFAVAALVLLPLRVPIEIGGDTANLLVPLYIAIAAGGLAYLLAALRLEPSGGPASAPGWALRGASAVSEGSAPSSPAEFWPRALRYLLATTVILYAVQSAYSEDVSNAIENIGFFLVPFSVLFVLLSEVEWTGPLLRLSLIGAGAVAVLCALVAIGEYVARDLFLNPELFDANQLHVYFRVNSVFYDPNILARYLALAMTAFGAYVAWAGDRRGLATAALAFGICLAALAFSFSISGFAALFAGLGMAALLRWHWRGAAAAAALGAVAALALLVAGGTPTSDIEDTRSIDSGHEDLLAGGIDLFAERGVNHLVGGWGSGAFGRAFYEEIEPGARTTVSHSEPVTVAAEQGVIGLAVYLPLLGVALITLLGAAAGSSLARATVGACFVAMLISSLGYTGFTTDPATWALLALGVALWRVRPA